MEPEGLAAVTEALRRRSPEALREALRRELVNARGRRDDRDVMVGMAPHHDCARRLGVDPVALFDEVADGLPPSLAQLAREFGRRRDIRPRSFAFEIFEEPDGPAYRWDRSWQGPT